LKQVELAPGIFHLQGGSNMGLAVRDGKGLLIDAGLDKDAARQALRAAEGLGVTLEAVFLTHAHADHFGGAYLLQQRLGVPLYAPALEAAMMEHPILEPLYLFGGAAPIRELRGKFTLAQACRIEHVIPVVASLVAPASQKTTEVVTTGEVPQETTEVVPTNYPLEIGPFRVEVVPLAGHAPNQVGVAVGEVLFCADAVFPAETLEKHKLTFCVDLDETLATLQRLPGLPYARFAPGHGPAYGAGEEIARACAANRARLEEVRERVFVALEAPQDTATLLQQVADGFGLRMATATAYLLTQTTVLAALSALERAGRVAVAMESNRLVWRRT
jgi:glyoxylase-like metal-dependent hydrolase (beta-lactamase superfamily II)